MDEWIKSLYESEIGTILENEPLYKYTSWKIGGPADVIIIPKNETKLIKALELLKYHGIPWKLLGRGSNILVSDKGFTGAIILLSDEHFNKIRFNNEHVTAGANTSLIRLANLVAKNGLTGLEFAGGIPGSVGGAVYMNAGAHGSDISNVLTEIDVLLENGKIEKCDKDKLDFSYRYSNLQRERTIILSASFKLSNGDRKKIAKQMALYKDKRRKSQPYNYPSSGSIFRNPKSDYAGRLIEELGLKGYQIGDAKISPIHANFIVNNGSAKATDVIRLIQYIKQKVYAEYQIELVPEVEIIGNL